MVARWCLLTPKMYLDALYQDQSYLFIARDFKKIMKRRRLVCLFDNTRDRCRRTFCCIAHSGARLNWISLYGCMAYKHCDGNLRPARQCQACARVDQTTFDFHTPHIIHKVRHKRHEALCAHTTSATIIKSLNQFNYEPLSPPAELVLLIHIRRHASDGHIHPLARCGGQKPVCVSLVFRVFSHESTDAPP